jgi:hypothetical protein
MRMMRIMKIKILVLNLTTKGIKDFEEEYKSHVEQGYRVEDTYDQEGAIIFQMEKWE